MKRKDLSLELTEKAKACTSAEELEALCKEAGIELSDDALHTLARNVDCAWGMICITEHT